VTPGVPSRLFLDPLAWRALDHRPGAGCRPTLSRLGGTGGHVYRGAVPDLDGRYFFADYGTAHLWSLRYDGSSPSSFDGTDYVELTDHTGDPAFTPDVETLDRVSRRMRR
jgi:hypothetical protein